MIKVYAERHWIREDKETDGAIFTSIDIESRGVTSLLDNPEGEPRLDKLVDISFVKASGTFHIGFKIMDDASKEATMKALSIMIEDLSTLRNEVIKLS